MQHEQPLERRDTRLGVVAQELESEHVDRLADVERVVIIDRLDRWRHVLGLRKLHRDAGILLDGGVDGRVRARSRHLTREVERGWRSGLRRDDGRGRLNLQAAVRDAAAIQWVVGGEEARHAVGRLGELAACRGLRRRAGDARIARHGCQRRGGNDLERKTLDHSGETAVGLLRGSLDVAAGRQLPQSVVSLLGRREVGQHGLHDTRRELYDSHLRKIEEGQDPLHGGGLNCVVCLLVLDSLTITYRDTTSGRR